MNAFEQIKSLETVTKIEAIVYLFRTQFPECLADLKPWIKSEATSQYKDPSSIDIGFHFSAVNDDCRCRSILMQVKTHQDSLPNDRAVIVHLSGYEAYQEQWQFSTVEDGEFAGKSQPTADAQELLKKVSRQILELFN